MEQNELSPGIKDPKYEISVRQVTTKELVAFDFGIMLTKDSKDIKVYIDDHLKEALDSLLETNQTVILKVNYFSQDVLLVATPVSSQEAL